MTMDEIYRETEALSLKEKGLLASQLLVNLGRPEYIVSDEEVSRRMEETENGNVQCISQEELLSGLDFLK